MIPARSARSHWPLLVPRLAFTAFLILSALGGPLTARAAPPPVPASSPPAGEPPPPDSPLAISELFTQTLVLHSDWGAGSDWTITPKAGTNNGSPTGTVPGTLPGLAVLDATLAPGGGTPQTDAFDYGLTLWVNNQIYSPTVVFTDSTEMDFGFQNMGGLNVGETFHLAAYDDATLRAVVTLVNNTASTIKTPVYWASNLGSDGNTTVYSTSSGDSTFTAADRWVITNDGPTHHDPIITHVFSGPGTPAVTASSVVNSVHSAPGGAIGVGATFSVTIPAASTRYLMIYAQLNPTNTVAYNKAATTFASNPAVGTDLVSGLTHAQLMNVLNWAFTNAAPLAQDDNLVAFTQGGPQPLFVLDNDTDTENDRLSFTAVTPPAHGTVSIIPASSFDPHLVYTPTAGYAGPDTFSYTITDGLGGSDSAQVNLTVGGPVSASLPWYLAAGVGASSLWEVNNDGGTSNGVPQGGTCSNDGAMNIYDAGLASQGDAFDGGLVVWLGNTAITSTSQVTVSAHNLEIAPMNSPGLRASLRYTGLSRSDTLRTLASFHNPLGIPAVAVITLEDNFGSDVDTGVRATSSGDLNFTAADRWLVTSDDDTSPNDVVNTQVLYGPGPVPVPAFSVSQVVYDCSGTQGMLARFSLTVPAGGTRRLMFFNQLHLTNAGAISAAAAFNGPLTLEMLEGLSAAERAQIVNWIMPRWLFLPLIRR